MLCNIAACAVDVGSMALYQQDHHSPSSLDEDIMLHRVVSVLSFQEAIVLTSPPYSLR